MKGKVVYIFESPDMISTITVDEVAKTITFVRNEGMMITHEVKLQLTPDTRHLLSLFIRLFIYMGCKLNEVKNNEKEMMYKIKLPST